MALKHRQTSIKQHNVSKQLNKDTVTWTRNSSNLDDFLPIPCMSRLSQGVCVFLVAVICYGVGYNADFVFDDSEAVTGNKDVELDRPWTELFWHDFWGNKLDSNTSHKSYRPLTVLTFRWSRYVAGGLFPCGFHVVNIVLHGLVCALTLPVFRILLCVKSRGQGEKGSVFCSLLFAVHPIHTESVVGVVGRADLLCALTFLSSFLCYERALNRGYNLSAAGLQWLAASMFLCVVSTLCKELGITVLGICCAYDILCHCRIDPLTIVGLRKDTSTKKDGREWLFQRLVVLTLTGSAVLVGRWRMMGSSPPTFQVVDNPHSFVDSTVLRALNYNYLYSVNAWLLLNPSWLCFDWSMGCVPTINSLLDVRLLAVAGFWIMMGSVVCHSLYTKPSDEQRCLMMALALLAVPFLPASNLLFRVGFVVAERVLYLPSLGYVLLIHLGLRRLAAFFSRSSTLRCLQAMTLLLLLMFAVRSYRRSLDWLSEKSLFESGEKVCPLNAKVHYNIAKIWADAGGVEEAINKYHLAISLNPRYDQALNNLGNLYKDKGELETAEDLLLRATDIRAEFAAAWMNLAIVQASLNKSSEAERSYYTALKHRKNYSDCYYNLGNLYLSQGLYPAALAAWRNATLQKPDHISAWNNMIILLDNSDRLQEMELVVKEALRYNPNDAGIHYNYANALGKASQYQEAEAYFLLAINLDSSVSSYYSNLAVLYHRWGKLEQADTMYQNALTLDPSASQTQQNYAMLLKKLGKLS